MAVKVYLALFFLYFYSAKNNNSPFLFQIKKFFQEDFEVEHIFTEKINFLLLFALFHSLIVEIFRLKPKRFLPFVI